LRSKTKYWLNRSGSPVHATSKIVQIPKIVQENPTVSGVKVSGTRQMERSRDAGLLLQLERSIKSALTCNVENCPDPKAWPGRSKCERCLSFKEEEDTVPEKLTSFFYFLRCQGDGQRRDGKV
jgi:hypothetical protein